MLKQLSGIVILCVAVASVAVPSLASGGGPLIGAYLTNVELLQHAVSGCVGELLADLPEVEEGAVELRFLGDSNADWLLEAEILEQLGSLRPNTVVRLGENGDSKGTGKARRPSGTPTLAVPAGAAIPEEVCTKGLGGTVVVRFAIDAAGSVTETEFEESAADELTEAVRAAAASYQFRPGMQKQVPVPGEIRLRFDFPIPGDDCAGMVVEAEVVGAADSDAAVPPEDPDETAAEGASVPVLACRLSELELSYPESSRRFFIGPERVERLARARVDLRLKRKLDVAWASSAENYVTDEVPRGMLPRLASEQHAFAAPKEFPRSGRNWEPFIVSGVVGGMIALFYSNQSGD